MRKYQPRIITFLLFGIFVLVVIIAYMIAQFRALDLNKPVSLNEVQFLPSFMLKNEVAEDESPQEANPVAPKEEAPIAPLPTGVQTYSISHGHAPNQPVVSDMTFYPLDVQQGQRQIIKIQVNAPTQINMSQLELMTDHETTSLPLLKTAQSGQQSTWQAEWVVSDTILSRYVVTALFANEAGEVRVRVAPRTAQPLYE